MKAQACAFVANLAMTAPSLPATAYSSFEDVTAALAGCIKTIERHFEK
jgi:hypothetical protein